MLLVSGATKTIARISDPRLGRLLRPGNGNLPDRLPWAVDNGAFTGFDAAAFLGALARFKGAPGCLWVAAPDVVADAAGTLEQFREWEPRLHADGWPVAFVAQDGLTDPPWDSFECLFIGGTTWFKLHWRTRLLIVEAKRRGKLVHMGRVNTVRRLRYAHESGCDSVDGTQFSRFPDRWIPWALGHLDRIERQQTLWSIFGG
jgi:hypothetical protein